MNTIPANMAAARSLTETVHGQIRNGILKGTIAPGAKLRINDLCAQYEVSAPAVREALSRLSAEGLVVAVAQRGFQVAPISMDDLKDLTNVRIEIEGLTLRRSMEVGGLVWESELVSAFYLLSKTAPPTSNGQEVSDDWARAHSAFHAALVAACDSPWLLRLRTMLYEQSERYRLLSIPYADSQRDFEAEHKAILDATLNRDPDQAVALLGKHLRATADILLNSEKLKSLQQP